MRDRLFAGIVWTARIVMWTALLGALLWRGR